MLYNCKKMIEQDRVFAFLAGLKPEPDQERVQVLGKEPFPSMKKVFALVYTEKSHRILILEKPSMENSAPIIHKSNNYSAAEKQEGRRSN